MSNYGSYNNTSSLKLGLFGQEWIVLLAVGNDDENIKVCGCIQGR